MDFFISGQNSLSLCNNTDYENVKIYFEMDENWVIVLYLSNWAAQQGVNSQVSQKVSKNDSFVKVSNFFPMCYLSIIFSLDPKIL